MILNRESAPLTNDISKIFFKSPSIISLSKKCPFIYWTDVKDNTVRLEFHFNAGKNVGKKNIAFFVNSLLFTGTNNKTSKQIHEELDFLGAYIQQQVALESAYITIYCLKNNLDAVLNIVFDVINNAVFTDKEIEDMLTQKRQQLKLSNQKVSYLASKKNNEMLYNSHKNYSRQTELDELDCVNKDDLNSFYKKYYLSGLKKVILVANIGENVINNIIKSVNNWLINHDTLYLNSLTPIKGQFHVEKNDAIQCSIKITRPFYTKKHEDYFSFQILQTFLGDYFGSRLMSNLREDKGFTYGIGSYIFEQKRFSVFGISTEVKKEVLDNSLKEIKNECERLQNEIIDANEINTVKQYMLGQLLRSTDGVNNLFDAFLSVYEYGLDLNFYQEFINSIKEINSEILQKTAQKYLNWNDFTIVSAG